MMDRSFSGCCGSQGNSGHQSQTTKRNFFQWAVKWYYANLSEDTRDKPDTPVLACLLQSLGFQLRQFEKIDDSCDEKKSSIPIKNDTVSVVIECSVSGMRACLEMKDVKCQCPKPEDTKDASFWSVSGTGPTASATVESANTIQESGSNLLPHISKESNKMIGEVIYHLINMIRDGCVDVNKNCKDRSNLNLSRMSSIKDNIDKMEEEEINDNKNDLRSIIRSHTQPEMGLSSASSAGRRFNSNDRKFENLNGATVASKECQKEKEKIGGIEEKKAWGETMDLETASVDGDQPRPSPPKIASSPVFLNQLCSSLGQISLQSEEEVNNAREYLIRAHGNIEKALEIMSVKKSPSSENSSAVDQSTFLKPKNVGTTGVMRKKSSSVANLRVSPTSRPGSSCSMPSRVSPATSNNTSAVRTITSTKSSITARRSVGSAFTKLSTAATTSEAPSITGSSKRPPTPSGISKIPARRKSFGAMSNQPLKLAIPKVQRSSSTTMASAGRKKSTSPIPPEKRLIITAKRRISPDPKSVGNQTGIQKPSASCNQFQTPNATSAAVTGNKITSPSKTESQAKDSGKKCVGNLNSRFGYGNKKA